MENRPRPKPAKLKTPCGSATVSRDQRRLGPPSTTFAPGSGLLGVLSTIPLRLRPSPSSARTSDSASGTVRSISSVPKPAASASSVHAPGRRRASRKRPSEFERACTTEPARLSLGQAMTKASGRGTPPLSCTTPARSTGGSTFVSCPASTAAARFGEDLRQASPWPATRVSSAATKMAEITCL